MNITINNTNPVSSKGYTYLIKANNNKKVKFLYNQVSDMIAGKGVSATFEVGNQGKIILNPPSKHAAHFLKNDLKKAGIKLSRFA